MNADPENTLMRKPDGLKKPYARPQILVHGDIHVITQAVKTTGASDNQGNQKTS